MTNFKFSQGDYLYNNTYTVVTSYLPDVSDGEILHDKAVQGVAFACSFSINEHSLYGVVILLHPIPALPVHSEALYCGVAHATRRKGDAHASTHHACVCMCVRVKCLLYLSVLFTGVSANVCVDNKKILFIVTQQQQYFYTQQQYKRGLRLIGWRLA